MILSAVRTPFLVLCIMLGIYVALEFSNIPKAFVGKASHGAIDPVRLRRVLGHGEYFGGICTDTRGTDRVSPPGDEPHGKHHPIVVYGVGILIVLNQLGISIAPILATLGVGGLAVALALKDTLSNFFAGFISSRQSRSGWAIT